MGVDGRLIRGWSRNGTNPGEEHRIVRQRIHSGQLERQPAQLLGQESFPQLISYRAQHEWSSFPSDDANGCTSRGGSQLNKIAGLVDLP